MKTLKLISFLILFLLVNRILSGQEETFSKYGKQNEIIEREIPSLMKQYSIPGLSLAIIRDGQIDYVKGYGVRNINTQVPVNGSTIFAAASLTKPVFSYLVLKLHDEGKIDIDTPLYKYIPVRYLEKYFIGGPVTEAGFDFEEFKKITGRFVLCHSTGLPVYQASKPLKFDFPPGTQFPVFTFSFRLLELAVYCIQGSDERDIFKTNLNDWVKEYVFDPLGMTSSSMIWRNEFNKKTVAGHDLFNSTSGEFVKNRYAGSQASLYTTAVDYARFIIAVMKGEGLKEKTAAEMLRSQVNMKEENNFWGLGVGLEKTTKGLYFWQWGDYGIHKAFMIGSSELKNGLVFFTNSYYGLCPSDDIIKIVILPPFGSPGGKGAAFKELHPDLAGLDGPDVVPFAEEPLIFRGSRRRDPGDAERGLGGADAAAPGGGSAGDRRLGSVPPAGRRALPGLVRLCAPRPGASRRGRLRPAGVVRRGARRRAARRQPRLLPDLRPARAQAPRGSAGTRPAALRDVGERGLGRREEGRAGLLVLRALGQLQGLCGRDAPARARDAAGAGPFGRGRVHVRPAPPSRRPRDPLDDSRLVRSAGLRCGPRRSGTPTPTPVGRS